MRATASSCLQSPTADNAALSSWTNLKRAIAHDGLLDRLDYARVGTAPTCAGRRVAACVGDAAAPPPPAAYRSSRRPSQHRAAAPAHIEAGAGQDQHDRFHPLTHSGRAIAKPRTGSSRLGRSGRSQSAGGIVRGRLRECPFPSARELPRPTARERHRAGHESGTSARDVGRTPRGKRVGAGERPSWGLVIGWG
jgi:hypothetical protein